MDNIYDSFFFPNPIIAATNTDKLTINATTTILFALNDAASTDISSGAGVRDGIDVGDSVAI